MNEPERRYSRHKCVRCGEHPEISNIDGSVAWWGSRLGAVCAFCANAIDREWALGNHIKELADNQKEHRAARGRRPRNSHVGERGNRD